MFVYFLSCDGPTFMEKLDTNREKKCTRSNSMMTFHNNSKITCTKEKDIKKGQHVLNLISLLKFPHIINQYELNYMKCLLFFTGLSHKHYESFVWQYVRQEWPFGGFRTWIIVHNINKLSIVELVRSDTWVFRYPVTSDKKLYYLSISIN
jgi:hypothetical protein